MALIRTTCGWHGFRNADPNAVTDSACSSSGTLGTGRRGAGPVHSQRSPYFSATGHDRAQTGNGGGPPRTRHLDAPARGVVFPAMEEAAKVSALDRPLRQVGAHVGAVGVEGRHDAVVPAVDGQVPAEQGDGPDPAAGKVARAEHPVPALGDDPRIVEDPTHGPRSPACRR